jgi:hypothetical protein
MFLIGKGKMAGQERNSPFYRLVVSGDWGLTPCPSPNGASGKAKIYLFGEGKEIERGCAPSRWRTPAQVRGGWITACAGMTISRYFVQERNDIW